MVGLSAGCVWVLGFAGGRGGALGRKASWAPVMGLSGTSPFGTVLVGAPVITFARRSSEEVSPVDISSNGKRSCGALGGSFGSFDMTSGG